MTATPIFISLPPQPYQLLMNLIKDTLTIFKKNITPSSRMNGISPATSTNVTFCADKKRTEAKKMNRN